MRKINRNYWTLIYILHDSLEEDYPYPKEVRLERRIQDGMIQNEEDLYRELTDYAM